MPSLSQAADFVPKAVAGLVLVCAACAFLGLIFGEWSHIGTAAGSLLP